MFDVHDMEVVVELIGEFPCALDKTFLAQGNMFITNHFIFFKAEILARKVKEKIFYVDVANVRKVRDKFRSHCEIS